MDIGEYIKAKRDLYNLTQVELAERAGVGIRFVRELEGGKTVLSSIRFLSGSKKEEYKSLIETRLNCI